MGPVLVADHDLGFVFWLGERLGRLGYEALPALSASQAIGFAKKHQVEVLVVNPALRRASNLLQFLSRSRKDLKVIVLPLDAQDRLSRFDNLEAAFRSAIPLSAWLAAQPAPPAQVARAAASPISAPRAAVAGFILGVSVSAALVLRAIPR